MSSASPACSWGRGRAAPDLLDFPVAAIPPLLQRPAWPLSLATAECLGWSRLPVSLWLQGMIFVVSHTAKSHFHLVLDTVTMFAAAFTRDRFYQTSLGWKVKDAGFCCLAFLFWPYFHFYTCSSQTVAAVFR